jgi:hypothetical protein
MTRRDTMQTEPTTILRHGNPRRSEQELRVTAGERERIRALTRLITLLKTSAPDAPSHPPIPPEESMGALSQLSHLRAAHASYSLTSGVMQRVSAGAWVRRRLN